MQHFILGNMKTIYQALNMTEQVFETKQSTVCCNMLMSHHCCFEAKFFCGLINFKPDSNLYRLSDKKPFIFNKKL